MDRSSPPGPNAPERVERRRIALATACLLGAAGATGGRAAERRVDWADVRLVDGQVMAADVLRGQPVVVEIWATWCPFCKKQNPHLQALHDATRGKGLQVLTFALDKEEQPVRDYLRRYGYSFPAAPYSAQAQRWFGMRRALPELYVVDTTGRIVLREEGEMFPEDIAALARFAARG